MSSATTDREPGHVPVMRDRIVELLDNSSQPIIVDGTLGAGGHSAAFLAAFPTAIVIGLDRDPYALAEANERLAPYAGRFFSVQTRFDGITTALHQVNENPDFPVNITQHGITGFLFDLGVSSMQLDQVERGFAYRSDAPLDMRMDPSLPTTAADILNTYSHGDLARIFKTYGEERFAGKIASAVVRERDNQPFDTSARFVELLYRTIPAATRRTGGHPAKRCFQALRVEVNAELEALRNVIPSATAWLRPGGVGVFMSYQSLEDKIVKQNLKQLTTSRTPPGLPMDLPNTAAEGELLTRGAEKATAEEIAANQRAAPVRVRAIKRISAPPHGSYPKSWAAAHSG